MKKGKLLSLVLLLFISFNSYSQSSFCEGFEEGFCEGWKDVKGEFTVCPVTPVCPVPEVGKDSYKGGYNTGFKAGREKAKNNNISNNKKASESNSGGEYNAYAMIGVVALSAVFLSNDLYAYGTASKYGFNPSFGFRKKFNNSAIEYGATYYNEDSKASKVLDFNFNFIHHIYKKQVPNSITPYIGLTTNTDLEDFGVGILFGGKIKLVERLNLDSRFEYTNTLGSRFHIGLIFTFQKEYFWKKKK